MSNEEFYEQIGVAMTCRSYEEYEKIFLLEDHFLNKGKILDVAAGASSFVAEANKRGYDAVAVDPLYNLTVEQMTLHGQKEMKEATEKLAKNVSFLSWDSYKDLEEHDRIRENSFKIFLDQYKINSIEKRFIPGSLPELPFEDETFSLVLCNHFLFLYHEQFDFEFHLKAIREMIRVTKKGGIIRVYPLVGFKNDRYPYLGELLEILSDENTVAKTIDTSFRFVPAATELLTINKL
ncbi:class I SAM-dependent methyltransferase [Priestia megaterium]|uniref:class I SAM-dependent methyltransferase n=1 Tax=Priestia megaterium TaxID=1404 RepID=UPI0012D961DD|nr:methyltransferase domain-containing protein [Priestia megaterium]MUL34290.1 Ubiquinone/menaquinone biosynthesis C-methyltransferase UbiE [Priestia megaterium]